MIWVIVSSVCYVSGVGKGMGGGRWGRDAVGVEDVGLGWGGGFQLVFTGAS